eukprot:1141894-Pelagomonas_calceolata.AAC.3
MGASVLQAALKLVMDPPAGLQSNLVSVMSALPRDIMAKVGATALPQANPEDLTTFSTNTGGCRWMWEEGGEKGVVQVCKLTSWSFAFECACVLVCRNGGLRKGMLMLEPRKRGKGV